MTAGTAASLTLGDALLPDTTTAGPDAVLSHLRSLGIYSTTERALGSLSRVAMDDVHKRLDAEVAAVLHMNLIDTIIVGWRKWDYLISKARQSRLTSDDVPAPLISHRIQSGQHSFVDITVDRLLVATIELTATATFDIVIGEAWLRDGRLIALGPGPCDIQVRFEAHTRVFHSRIEVSPPVVVEGHRQFELRSRLSFGHDGIRLIADQER